MIVRTEDAATAENLMEAVGTFSDDGTCFSVVVTREKMKRNRYTTSPIEIF